MIGGQPVAWSASQFQENEKKKNEIGGGKEKKTERKGKFNA
jgi:hypothetical protein